MSILHEARARNPRRPLLPILIILAVVPAFLLLTEHRAHLFGFLPYALVLLCPLMHLLMHGRHGGHGSKPGREAKP